MRKNITSLFALLALIGATSTDVSAASTPMHYERGFELMDMGRWVDARCELLEAKRAGEVDEPLVNQRVDYALALCAVKLEMQGGEQSLVSLSKQYPQAPYDNDILFIRGLIEAANGDHKGAMELFDEVDSKRLRREDRERYDIRQGYLNFMDRDYERASEYLDKIEPQSKYYPHAVYCKSYISYNNGDYAAARSGFEQLAEDESFGAVVPYYLMQCEFEMGNYERSIDYGTKLLEGDTEHKQREVVRTLAEANYRLKRYDETLRLIDEYAEAGGELTREEQYIKGFSLHQLGWYAEAIEPLKLACGADDEMTQNASFHLANCYIHTGDKSGAKQAFSMASNESFNAEIAEEALFNYAKLQYELGDGVFNEAVNLLTRYVTTYDDPKRLSTAHTLLVAAYYNTRDYEAAYENIKLIKNPDAEVKAAKQKITYLRGLEHYNRGEYDQAAKYLNESISIGVTAKQIALAGYWSGEVNYLEGRYAEALNDYNFYLARAPKSDPMVSQSYYSIGYAMMQQGNKKSALEYFERYVDSPSATDALRTDAYCRIGDIRYSARSYVMAADSYAEAVEIGGRGSNYARYQRAIISGIQGNAQSKITQLKRITQAECGEEWLDDAHYELGRSYIGVEQYRDAIKSHLSFLEEYPSSPFYAQALSDLGVAYVNTGDKQSSLKYYDLAIKAAPQSQVAKDAMQGIREIYIGDGQAEEYFDYAEQNGMEGDLNAVTRDSLSFASARGLYLAGGSSNEKLRSAATALEGYIKGYPKGYYLNDALFFLSDSYIKIGNETKAIETLERLGARGRNQYSETLYTKLSSLCYTKGDYTKAAAASRNLYDIAKSDKVRHEAMTAWIDAVVLAGDDATLERACREVISLGESKTGDDATTKANYHYATALRKRGERREALEIYAKLAKGNSEFKCEAQYYTIEDSFRSGNKEQTKELIFGLSEQSDVDPYWLAKSFILLGDIYVAEGDNFQARATYQSIVDGYSNQSDGVIEQAKSKIAELK